MTDIQLSATDLRRIADHLDALVDAHNRSKLSMGVYSGIDVKMDTWSHALLIQQADVPAPKPVSVAEMVTAPADSPKTIRAYVLTISQA